MNQTIRKSELEELKHYGVIGMKWGKTLRGYASRSLTRQTNKVARGYDKGRETKEKASEISRRVRKEKYKLERKIKRASKYLDKASKADAQKIINRYNKDPEKRALVEDYMKTLKMHSTTMEKLRMDLIDIRL